MHGLSFREYLGIKYRTTVSDLFQLLDKAELINLLEDETPGISSLAKIDKVYLNNPNLSYVLAEVDPEIGNVRETIHFICEKCYNFHGLFLRFTARRIITYYRFYDVSVVVVVYFKGNASLLMTYLFHHVVEGIVGYVIVMSFYFVNGFIPLGCR